MAEHLPSAMGREIHPHLSHLSQLLLLKWIVIVIAARNACVSVVAKFALGAADCVQAVDRVNGN